MKTIEVTVSLGEYFVTDVLYFEEGMDNKKVGQICYDWAMEHIDWFWEEI